MTNKISPQCVNQKDASGVDEIDPMSLLQTTLKVEAPSEDHELDFEDEGQIFHYLEFQHLLLFTSL